MSEQELAGELSVVERTELGEPIYGVGSDFESQLHKSESYRRVESDEPIEEVLLSEE